MESNIEIWKDINGYEGFYQVSSFGRIKRIISKGCTKEKIRKIQYKKNGYAVVMLSVSCKYKLVNLSRLVAESFISNPENKPEVNHKDLNKQNNFISNLEWSTKAENMNHLNLNKKWSNNAKKGAENTKSIKVFQYDLSGNKINEYDSITIAANNIGICTGEITICCQKKRKTAGGFQWKYASDLTIIQAVDYGRKKVGKFNMNLELIEVYKNSYIASKENNLPNSGIWNCCNGKYKHCGNFIWKYII